MTLKDHVYELEVDLGFNTLMEPSVFLLRLPEMVGNYQKQFLTDCMPSKLETLISLSLLLI